MFQNNVFVTLFLAVSLSGADTITTSLSDTLAVEDVRAVTVESVTEQEVITYRNLSIYDANNDGHIENEELSFTANGEMVPTDKFDLLLDHDEFKQFLLKKGLVLKTKRTFEINWMDKEIPEGIVKDVGVQFGLVNRASTSAFQFGVVNYGASRLGRFGCINKTLKTRTNSGSSAGANIALISNKIEGDLSGAAISLFYTRICGDLNGLATGIFASLVDGSVNGILGASFYNRIGESNNGVIAGIFNYVGKNRVGVTLGLFRNGTVWYDYIDWIGVLTFMLFGAFLRFRPFNKTEKDKKEKSSVETIDTNQPTPYDETIEPSTEREANIVELQLEESNVPPVTKSVEKIPTIEKIGALPTMNESIESAVNNAIPKQ